MHQSKYIAKEPNSKGIIPYTAEENETWAILYARQKDIVIDRACDEFITGLQKLRMPEKSIPQCHEMNERLQACTGWKVQPVAALIPEEEYFDLLAHKTFPGASFIRRRAELDYLQEPDIFHEFFGHSPMLTDQAYADFQQAYGKLALAASPEERIHLMRLYWFTIEFGLIQTDKGLRAYGGGILSSAQETVSCLIDKNAIRLPFGDGMTSLRTPYRIDMVQPLYFVLQSFQELYDVLTHDLMGKVHQAQDLGDLPPNFPPLELGDTNVNC